MVGKPSNRPCCETRQLLRTKGRLVAAPVTGEKLCSKKQKEKQLRVDFLDEVVSFHRRSYIYS